MSKMWIFGNSFSMFIEPETFRVLEETEDPTPLKKDFFWPLLLVDELNVKEIFNSSPPGFACTVELVKERFDSLKHEVKQNDRFIFILPDFTDVENFNGYFRRQSPTEEQFIKNGNLCAEIIKELHHLTEKFNLYTVVMPSMLPDDKWLKENNIAEKYPLLNVGLGGLGTINQNEHDHTFPDDVKRYDSVFKSNHMLRSNHKILAEKILDNYKNNTPIDLSTGFIENAINDKTYEDKEFLSYEYYVDPTPYIGQYHKVIEKIRENMIRDNRTIGKDMN